MQCSVVVSCLLRVSTCLVAWAAWSIVFDHFYKKREKTTGPVCWLWWNEWKTVHCSKICQRYVKHFVVNGLETVLILVVPFQRGGGRLWKTRGFMVMVDISLTSVNRWKGDRNKNLHSTSQFDMAEYLASIFGTVRRWCYNEQNSTCMDKGSLKK